MSIVAVGGDRIVGHILFSPFTIETNGRTATLLGLTPMAVSDECQRKGYGFKLVEKGLEESQANRYSAVVFLGPPGYYLHFAFASVIHYTMAIWV